MELAVFLSDSSEVSIHCTGVDHDADDLENIDKTENASDNDDKSEKSITDPATLPVVQHKEPTDLPFEGCMLVNLTKNLASNRLETRKYLINFFTLH